MDTVFRSMVPLWGFISYDAELQMREDRDVVMVGDCSPQCRVQQWCILDMAAAAPPAPPYYFQLQVPSSKPRAPKI
jgi:hypothetical protein